MGLRTFRRVLAVVFLISALAWLLLGPARFAPGREVARLQIIPSALAVTLGATAFWIVMTLLFGRLYCSTVCPVGTLQDIVTWTRRRLSRRVRPFRYSSPSPARIPILWLYILTLLMGWLPLAYVLEPWNMLRDAAATVRPEAVAPTWGASGRWALAGIVAGTAVLAGVLVAAWWKGRAFCTSVCPIGTALGEATPVTMYRIAIDPDRCTGCLKCEDVCPSECIKVTERRVDNNRCVRCFDCLAACPEDAIRFQPNANRRPAAPLMTRQQ